MRYHSDLTKPEWKLIRGFFARRASRGRKPTHPLRYILEAIFYLVRSGCQWRMLPRHFPAWQTVYGYFRRWNLNGIWEQVLDALNRKRRLRLGKKASPSYGIIDSQSVKTIYASEDIGIDGGKKTKGRKRHHVVDIDGHLLHVSVHAANTHDTKAAPAVLARVAEKFPRIEAFSADAGYRGTTVNYVVSRLKLACHISTKIKDGFAVLPKRWVVERTFAWIGNFRRLSKDYEILTGTAENIVRLAMIKIMLGKLC